MLQRVKRLPALLALGLLASSLSCRADEKAEDAGSRSSAVASSTTQAGEDAAASTQPVAAKSKPRPKGRPLPAFSGWSLDDRSIDVSEMLGQRLVIFFFDPDSPESKPAADAMAKIAALRAEHNFEILGVARGADRSRSAAFADQHGLSFAILDDSSGTIGRRFGLEVPVAVAGVDAEGYLYFGRGGFGSADATAIEREMRNALRLPAVETDEPRQTMAPDFVAQPMDGQQDFALSEHRGEAIVLIFFLHTCPHCHAALGFLRTALAELPEDKRPRLVGIEVSGRSREVRERLQQEKLDFFPVYFDEGSKIQQAYGVFAGVPDIFLIDVEGKIASRSQGWYGPRDEPLTKMRLAQIARAPVPMLLAKEGYSGNEICGVCHATELATWELSEHAGAFGTLVRHGADTNPECIGCHVVGYEKPGGFVDSLETKSLENVGCESCHGRGGPHQSPGFVVEENYEATCLGCHDEKHSLGFDYAEFRPRISHRENAHLLDLPLAEKQRLLAERGRPGADPLGGADFVGSEACRDCHEAEFSTWAASPHARAIERLETADREQDPDCQRCHTTAFGRPGGFPGGADPALHADLARVGCESCHGPGGNHVAEGAQHRGSILALRDKCDSCVILQICGSCHDDANDPGFEFEVQERIEAQRHGTIGTPAEKAPNAGSAGANRVSDEVARAFDARDRQP